MLDKLCSEVVIDIELAGGCWGEVGWESALSTERTTWGMGVYNREEMEETIH